MANPRQYKIPDWFLNRQKDIVDGKYSQVCITKEKEILNYIMHSFTTNHMNFMYGLDGSLCQRNCMIGCYLTLKLNGLSNN